MACLAVGAIWSVVAADLTVSRFAAYCCLLHAVWAAAGSHVVAVEPMLTGHFVTRPAGDAWTASAGAAAPSNLVQRA
jgi:hypothetical protein